MLTKEQVIEEMKKRGYEPISHIQSGDEITALTFIKKPKEGLTINAKVSLKAETVVLYFVELEYFCELRTAPFDLYHKDFAKYEQIFLMYIAKCLGIDVFETLKVFRTEGVTEGVNENGKKDVTTRKREFWDQIVQIGKQRGYPKDNCKACYDYFTQMNPGGVKMQFEIIKSKKGVFDVGGRLATWMKNDREWADAKKNIVEKKIEKQEQEITAWKPVTKHKDLFG